MMSGWLRWCGLFPLLLGVWTSGCKTVGSAPPDEGADTDTDSATTPVSTTSSPLETDTNSTAVPSDTGPTPIPTDTADTEPRDTDVLPESLMPDANGWLDETSCGFQGRFFTYTDAANGGASTITPAVGDPLLNDGSHLCVDGEASQVLNEQWEIYEGAGFGMALCVTSPEQVPPETDFVLSGCPFNRDLGEIFLGVEFDIEGEWGVELRVEFVERNRDPNTYVEITSSGHMQAMVDDAQVWYDTSAPGTDVNNIEAIRFHVATRPDTSTPFDFCISNLAAILR